MLANIAGVADERIALLSVVFVVARVLHGVFYIAGAASARSLAWGVGMSCSVALLTHADSRAT